MWTDNASDIDMLFYNPYAEIISNTAIETDDSSLTIGVFGLWGAGKSTLLKLVEDKYEEKDGIECVSINAWMFESYEDAKSAIMEALLRELSEKKLFTKVKCKIQSLIKRIDFFKLGTNLVSSAAPIIASVASGNPLPMILSLPNTSEKIGDTIKAVVSGIQNLREEYVKSEDASDETVVNNIRIFREEFQSIIIESEINRVVVLIDDLDRCQPDRIIETLEVIKLFLSVDKTTFIIAADENVIQYAIKKKYPKIDGFNIDLDKEYIEKMIQVPISIPELSNKDIQNYLLLLVLQKYLKEEEFNKIIKKIEEEKVMVTQSDPIEISMIESSISNIFDSVPLEKKDEYKEVMDAILQIRSIAAYTLKGNPRQIKRFLNTFVMKRQLSKLYYGDELDMKIMAKLLILHKLDSRLFDELNEWNSYYDTENENYKLMREALENETVDEYKKWQRPHIKKWVECEPVYLEKINLDRYFYLTREILNTQNEITVDLSTSAKKVLEKIGSISKANVPGLIDDIKALSVSDLDNVMVVILSKIEKKAINVYVYSQLYLTFEDYRQQICEAILKSDYKIKAPDIPLYKEMYRSDRNSINNFLEELQTRGRIKENALNEIINEGE